MKVKCECGKEVELKEVISGFDKTIVKEMCVLCDCNLFLTHRIYDLDEEEVENIRGYLK